MKLDCDLECHFGELLDMLPADPDDEVMLTDKDMPEIIKPLSTNAIVIKSNFFVCNNTLAERITLYLHRRTLRLFGLLLLSRIFCPGESFINITSEATEVRNVVIDTEDTMRGAGCISSYHQKAVSFEYYGREHTRWPLARWKPRACPSFFLTKEGFDPSSHEDWPNRDLLYVTGIDTAILDLAQICLDMGRTDSEHCEFDLETEVANGGVAPGSAALKVWLPGSIGWLDEIDDALPGQE